MAHILHERSRELFRWTVSALTKALRSYDANRNQNQIEVFPNKPAIVKVQRARCPVTVPLFKSGHCLSLGWPSFSGKATTSLLFGNGYSTRCGFHQPHLRMPRRAAITFHKSFGNGVKTVASAVAGPRLIAAMETLEYPGKLQAGIRARCPRRRPTQTRSRLAVIFLQGGEPVANAFSMRFAQTISRSSNRLQGKSVSVGTISEIVPRPFARGMSRAIIALAVPTTSRWKDRRVSSATARRAQASIECKAFRGGQHQIEHP
jgi:hypothetical protein